MERKILIADDAAFMRMMIKRSLAALQDVVFLEAEDGQAACGLYEQEKPDLVIMDITMPVMDGISAVKMIRKMDPSARILMCSAMGQESMVVESIRSGALDFIVKPFKAEALLNSVQRILKNDGGDGDGILENG